jgi:hypothetical protein
VIARQILDRIRTGARSYFGSTTDALVRGTLCARGRSDTSPACVTDPAGIREELDLRVHDLEEELRLRLGEDRKLLLTGQLRRQVIADEPDQHVDTGAIS